MPFSNWSATNVLRAPARMLVPGGRELGRVKMRVLETDRLILRAFRGDDLRDVALWTDDTVSAEAKEIEAHAFLDYCFREYRERGIGPWGMFLKRNAVMVGNCGYPHLDLRRQSGEINYFVAAHHRRQGLATEAIGALLEFGFRDMGLVRVQARSAPDNLASERVMQKAGMSFERVVCSGEGSRADKLYAIVGSRAKPRAAASGHSQDLT